MTPVDNKRNILAAAPAMRGASIGFIPQRLEARL
jgi:hypothetical protein